MNYTEYYHNAEKHYCYCNEIMSVDWEGQFTDDVKCYIRTTLFNYLKDFDGNYAINEAKFAFPDVDFSQNSEFIGKLDKILQDMQTVRIPYIFDFRKKFKEYLDEPIALFFVKYGENVESIIRSFFVDILGENDKIDVLINTIDGFMGKKLKKFKKDVQAYYENKRRCLYHIYLNAYYLSGYIFEGLAMFSILKLFGFNEKMDYSSGNLKNITNYEREKLALFINGTEEVVKEKLENEFAEKVNQHLFCQYIMLIRNHNETKDIEFIGKPISDSDMENMVTNWTNKLRYKKFNSFDITRLDIMRLLNISNAIKEQVNYKILKG